MYENENFIKAQEFCRDVSVLFKAERIFFNRFDLIILTD